MSEFIGKQVIVKGPFGRDNRGKSNNQIVEVGGKCQYIGPNEILGHKLVVVLNRMPLVINNISQITKRK